MKNDFVTLAVFFAEATPVPKAKKSASPKASPKRTPAALRRLGVTSVHDAGMDANGDGRVSRSEARKYREASQTPSKEAPQTVNAIKAQLLELGLSTKGVKSELMARLADGESSLDYTIAFGVAT